MSDEISKKIENISEAIDTRLVKAEGQIKENGQASTDLKAELISLTEKHEEAAAEVARQLQAIKAEKENIQSNFVNPQGLTKSLMDNKEKLASFYEGKNIDKAINIDLMDPRMMGKAADMISSNATSGGITNAVVPPQYVPGIMMDPMRAHIRDFIPQSSTTANNVPFISESAFDNGAAAATEGSDKPQSDFDLLFQESLVKKIAHYFRFSAEMMADIPGLQGYVQSRGIQKLLFKEDIALLYGVGTGIHVKGLTVAGTAYVGHTFGSTVSRWQILLSALTQARIDEYAPSLILLHPADEMKLYASMEAGTGAFRVQDALISGSPIKVMGARILSSTAVTEGDFLVGDFSLGCQLFFRENVSAKFYFEDQDNAIKNLVTCVIEERLVLNTYHPKAFRYGTWANALAVGSGGSAPA